MPRVFFSSQGRIRLSPQNGKARKVPPSPHADKLRNLSAEALQSYVRQPTRV